MVLSSRSSQRFQPVESCRIGGSVLIPTEQRFSILNMRSVTSGSIAEAPPAGDLTTRARIRDAAVARFPRDGFSGTTIRAIAADVGVSPGLVLHHFGSKVKLRRECDEYVIRQLGDVKRESLRSGGHREGNAVLAAYRLVEPVLKYLAWTLTTGGEAAAQIFDDLLSDVVRQLEDYQETGLVNLTDDTRSQATVLLAMQLGGLVLHEHTSRALAADTLSAQGLMKTAPFELRVFSGELFNQAVIADAQRAVSEFDPTSDTETKKEEM